MLYTVLVVSFWPQSGFCPLAAVAFNTAHKLLKSLSKAVRTAGEQVELARQGPMMAPTAPLFRQWQVRSSKGQPSLASASFWHGCAHAGETAMTWDVVRHWRGVPVALKSTTWRANNWGMLLADARAARVETKSVVDSILTIVAKRVEWLFGRK